MRIPLEHFCTTPVFALSPSANNNNNNNGSDEHKSRSGSSSIHDPSLKYPSLMNSNCKDKKMNLPDSLGLLMTNSLQSVGSAPNSPGLARRNFPGQEPVTGLPTVSGVVGFASNGSNSYGPISLPSTAAMITNNPYATLPKK